MEFFHSLKLIFKVTQEATTIKIFFFLICTDFQVRFHLRKHVLLLNTYGRLLLALIHVILN